MHYYWVSISKLLLVSKDFLNQFLVFYTSDKMAVLNKNAIWKIQINIFASTSIIISSTFREEDLFGQKWNTKIVYVKYTAVCVSVFYIKGSTNIKGIRINNKITHGKSVRLFFSFLWNEPQKCTKSWLMW